MCHLAIAMRACRLYCSARTGSGSKPQQLTRRTATRTVPALCDPAGEKCEAALITFKKAVAEMNEVVGVSSVTTTPEQFKEVGASVLCLSPS